MKKLTSLLLAVVMVFALFAFTGCGKSDEELVIGTWEGVITGETLKDAVTKEVDAETVALFDLSKLKDLKIIFEFKSGNTVEGKVDEQSAKEFIDAFYEMMVDAMLKTLKQTTGTDITKEQMFTLLQTTEEDFKKQTLEEVDINELTEEFTFEANTSFEMVEGKLFIDDDFFGAYTLDGDKLTVTDDGVSIVFTRK